MQLVDWMMVPNWIKFRADLRGTRRTRAVVSNEPAFFFLAGWLAEEEKQEFLLCFIFQLFYPPFFFFTLVECFWLNASKAGAQERG